ncbi:MAG: PAS domain-containing protein [Cyanomargarita calcarea GSE-NOS-MK-12-04C]|jgi:PAS domain S-box-containing protein|uniref:PAS domain-containing protein n=1 Tax=Cyanomargarita calcarea GSE-NOS-MK-12-04C TaxID=2839659 RepID=A0A951URT6_9CYAN|nr:PAS domain-containing protein [Cyanomargarita calcarea GSE-NOS-MK-12-04C]
MICCNQNVALEIAAMPVLTRDIEDSIVTVAPDTPLIDIISFLGQVEKLPTVDNININVESPKLLSLNLGYSDCAFVVQNCQLKGIFTLADVVRLVATGVNFAEVKIGEVMKEPEITLEENFDINTTLSLMRSRKIRHLPIVNNVGQLLGVVTPEIIALRLQSQLQKAENDLKIQTLEKEELLKANKLLQRAICDRIATEAQLLQTTSELQEIFQAFPDIYFRLASDGTILSYHARKIFDLYLPQEAFLGKRMQDVLTSDVSYQFQQAILQVHQTNSLVAIEYSLPLATGEKSFEARLLPSIQHQIIVIIREITERKQAQKELLRAKDELEIRVYERTKELKNTNERLLQEIIERQRIEEVLRYRADFEKLITTISTHFINLAPDQIDNGINQALHAIGEFANVDHSYIFLFAENYTQVNKSYEWCAKRIEGIIHDKTENSIALLPWILEKLCRFEIIHIPFVSELRAEASIEKQILILQNIKSLIIIPIVCSGSLIGYLGFDSVSITKSWTEESIALLKMVGEMLGNTLERKRVDQTLRVSKERYMRAISAGKVGIWEWNIQTNEIYIDSNLKAMLGYSDREITNYFDDWLTFIHRDDIESVKVEINAYLENLISKYEIEHRMRHKDGSYMWFLARGTVMRNSKGTPCFIAGSNTDITARKQADIQLKASLKEKELLLKEIHHRVKNNLQVISSLLRLQAGYIKDEQALDVFRDSQNRVRAMALIHENLYQSSDLARIEFSDYIQKLINNLIRCYGVNRNITIKLNIDKILLRIDTAIPCGLIINELVSNALKHAFVDGATGEIYVDFIYLDKGKFTLSISDNGVGVPKDIEFYRKKSLGLQLVWNLVEQLEGTIAYNTKLGTLFTIAFFEPN